MVDVLLDTNAAIALLKRNPELLQTLENKRLHFFIVVWGELNFGAYNSMRINDNLRAADYLMSRHLLHLCDRQTSLQYGRIKAQLRKIGWPILDNDIGIAACAIQHELQLVTRDGHFQHVGGISRLSW
ncbi:MAG TPA: PIN domain-containing protein [Candidatus Kapabacteria bacterium]|jgi:tRNA(fMet)-specific endonuclease VapC